MIQTYISLDGQSIYDVCLNTYGTLNLLVKLMSDNAYPSVDNYPPSRSQFQYDDTLTVNQSPRATSGAITPFATRVTGIGSVAYHIGDNGAPVPVGLPVPVGAQSLYDGIIDDGVNYDAQFYDDL